MTSMHRPNRKQRRRAVQRPRTVALRRDLEPAEQLAIAAGVSLELSDEQIDEACETLFYEPERTELADMVEARVLELLHLSGCADPQAETALEERKGREFFARVAAMGKPAQWALSMAQKPIAALSTLILAVVLFLWPSVAKASERVSAPLDGAHKIQRRNNRPRRRRYFGRLNQAAYHPPRGWTRSSRKSAGSPRLFTSSRSSEIGYGRELESCNNRARSSKSSSSGGAAAFTSGGFPRVTPTSRFSVATERSRARRTVSGGAFRKMTTPTRVGA
jgi:hypothetical protein